MNKYKAGLHKDVPTIFKGVWNPEQENSQASTDPTEASVVTYAEPAAMPLEYRGSQQKPKFATILKVFAEAPGHLFRSKKRREKRRLLSISRHLLINQPG
jgi:hypothetical protein